MAPEAASHAINGCAAHMGGRVLTSKGQTCSLGTAFTNWQGKYGSDEGRKLWFAFGQEQLIVRFNETHHVRDLLETQVVNDLNVRRDRPQRSNFALKVRL